LKHLPASPATEIQGFLGRGSRVASSAEGKTAEVAELLGQGHSVFSTAYPIQRDKGPEGLMRSHQSWNKVMGVRLGFGLTRLPGTMTPFQILIQGHPFEQCLFGLASSNEPKRHWVAIGPTLVSLQAGYNNQDDVCNAQGCQEDKTYEHETKNEA
jgi:hypothetical protein